jgi:hypothetical protein
MLQFTVQEKCSEVHPNVFVLLTIIITVPVASSSAERSFSKAETDKDLPQNDCGAGVIILLIENESDVTSALDCLEILSQRKQKRKIFSG